MNRKKQTSLIILLLIALILVDFTSKEIARVHLQNKSDIELIGGFLTFTYAENSAGMLNLGTSLPLEVRFWVFRIFVGIALAGMLIYLLLAKNLALKKMAAFLFIISGGIGNLIDRFMQDGVVTDFMVVGFSFLHTGIFNFADMFIMIGMFIILLDNLFRKKNQILDKD